MLDSIKQKLILIVIIILGCVLIFFPHVTNPYPLHVNEWNQISKSIELKNLNYQFEFISLEIGFQIILLFFSSFINLVLYYKFFPAIFSIFSVLCLFYIVRKSLINYDISIIPIKDRYLIAIISIIFFFSLKSNIEILGNWYFVPLTFTIPLIYLYIFHFNYGIMNKNSKSLKISLFLMILTLFIYPISLLFSVPILLIYCLINLKKIKQVKFLGYFLLIPIIGLFFYSIILKKSLITSIFEIFSLFYIKEGLRVLEFNNSFLEIYSFIGYIFAIIGFVLIFKNPNLRKNLLIYLIWPVVCLIMIFFSLFFEFSIFAPSKRYFLYFAISLPILSSYGFYFFTIYFKNKFNNEKYQKIIFVCILIITIILLFYNYYNSPNDITIHKTIDPIDYEVLSYLLNYDSGTIITPLIISPAVFPISGNTPLDTININENRNNLEEFYTKYDCNEKIELLRINNVSYVYSIGKIDCNWQILYSKSNRYIYYNF